ncbi:Mor transcription activator family protein [Pseudomonas citronellolis]|uniref:Mor transcription activator family protein n=1 Tax=Pseudomonas citronellolis TaxID=53408 RepID=UPI0023E3F59D|nr:Mor transcription activator family protein [Pseudomonas citronellolis]MDF3931378.1 Mor transcription activator family protein [Pseudomonas citronellolis]
MNLEQVRDQLPAQVLEIAEVVGMPAALRLVAELGGTTWEFAKGGNRSGQIRVAALADVIGDEAAQLLTSRVGGTSVYIPRCDAALRRLRDLEIHRQFEQAVREGVSANTVVAELARTYQLSDRRIWIILKQVLPEPYPTSADLFD